MMTCDVVDKIGNRAPQDVTRKDVIDLVMMVVDRGANTLAGTHHYYCCFLMAISA
jgi:hypothetical protein